MKQQQYNSKRTPRLLNVGCGRRFHGAWINVDLEAWDPIVMQHDITRGLPFADNEFDAVYHSHVLEHLKPEDGKRLLDECHRVLRPGGVLRIVVPNLEQIAKLYLKYHGEAWSGDDGAAINYNWMKLELLDQLVRGHSGGTMGQYMASDEIKNSGFVRSRVGDEFSCCRDMSRGNDIEPVQNQSVFGWLKKHYDASKLGMTRWIVRQMLGKDTLDSFDEGIFRSQGEIHRWMYDRYSLKELCVARGFTEFKVQTATGSSIDDYESFELDSENGVVRKPDSLFVECRKLEARQLRKAA